MAFANKVVVGDGYPGMMIRTRTDAGRRYQLLEDHC